MFIWSGCFLGTVHLFCRQGRGHCVHYLQYVYIWYVYYPLTQEKNLVCQWTEQKKKPLKQGHVTILYQKKLLKNWLIISISFALE